MLSKLMELGTLWESGHRALVPPSWPSLQAACTLPSDPCVLKSCNSE